MLLNKYNTAAQVVLVLSLCATILGCRDSGMHEVSQISCTKGIVKIGMSAHDVKAILGPPCSENAQVLTCSSATGTNAESTRILYWVLEKTTPLGKQVSVYDLSFTTTHPWSQVPSDPASDNDKDEAGWTLERIRRQIINNRDFERWKRNEQAEEK